MLNMIMLNIGGNPDDKFYRYKMPCVLVKLQNNKTILVNLKEIAKSLNCNPESLGKYISKEIGTHFDNKKYELAGNIEKDRIQKIILKFVNRYILCSKCKLPELNNKICNAYGSRN